MTPNRMSYGQMTLHEPYKLYMSNANDATRQTCSKHSFPSAERNIPVPWEALANLWEALASLWEALASLQGALASL